MDKNAAQILQNAKMVIENQEAKIAELKKFASELNHHKLAFDIARRVSESQEPEEFFETMEMLLSKPHEDLQKRAEVLSVMDPRAALDLGSPVSDKEADAGASNRGATHPVLTPGPGRREAMRQAINGITQTD